MRRFLKLSGVIIGALLLTTLGISASDTLQGVSGSLVSMVLMSKKVSGCGDSATMVVSAGRKICVDIFEASAGVSCPFKDPKNLQETEKNLGTALCGSAVAKDATPWRFINLSQAQRACAAGGKRLPSNEEWYRSALGTPEEGGACDMRDANAQGPRNTKESACKSGSGAYDMVGNVWEWVDASVQDGKYNNRGLPDTGYITGVDTDGVALSTDAEHENDLYGKDYFWQNKEGVRGMIRGGFYGSENDGGLYALNASVDLGFGSVGVGFRCVRDYSE